VRGVVGGIGAGRGGRDGGEEIVLGDDIHSGGPNLIVLPGVRLSFASYTHSMTLMHFLTQNSCD
jgi:hypothetical protein